MPCIITSRSCSLLYNAYGIKIQACSWLLQHHRNCNPYWTNRWLISAVVLSQFCFWTYTHTSPHLANELFWWLSLCSIKSEPGSKAVDDKEDVQQDLEKDPITKSSDRGRGSNFIQTSSYFENGFGIAAYFMLCRVEMLALFAGMHVDGLFVWNLLSQGLKLTKKCGGNFFVIQLLGI